MMAARAVDLLALAEGRATGRHVVELAPGDTHDLRGRVLRDSTASREVTFDGDGLPTTAHLGIADGDRVVAVSTWLVAPFTDRPGATAVQLRGMATEPSLQGQGLGAMLLDAGLRRARTDGADLVWARARTSALAFYLAHGFVAVGQEFIDDTTGLPHVIVARQLD
jgi:predicted GNAT family N-acyltransferase